jgi:16S rRNA C1402 N4-methylase RsmH
MISAVNEARIEVRMDCQSRLADFHSRRKANGKRVTEIRDRMADIRRNIARLEEEERDAERLLSDLQISDVQIDRDETGYLKTLSGENASDSGRHS